jgi:hypothetical protein
MQLLAASAQYIQYKKKSRMKPITLILCAALMLGACGKDDKPSGEQGGAPAAGQAEGKGAAGQAQDGPAIATVETADFVLKVHKAIPFEPNASKTGGAFKPRDGNRFVALDISVRNKSQRPLAMGTIMLQTQIVDDSGKSHGNMLPVLTAYTLSYPDPAQQEQYEAIWAMEYAPGAFHRTVAEGFEAPKELKSFTIRVPVRPNADEKAEAKFTL